MGRGTVMGGLWGYGCWECPGVDCGGEGRRERQLCLLPGEKVLRPPAPPPDSLLGVRPDAPGPSCPLPILFSDLFPGSVVLPGL